jgi:hypothetical protein
MSRSSSAPLTWTRSFAAPAGGLGINVLKKQSARLGLNEVCRVIDPNLESVEADFAQQRDQINALTDELEAFNACLAIVLRHKRVGHGTAQQLDARVRSERSYLADQAALTQQGSDAHDRHQAAPPEPSRSSPSQARRFSKHLSVSDFKHSLQSNDGIIRLARQLRGLLQAGDGAGDRGSRVRHV